jgi:hypothetical protein
MQDNPNLPAFLCQLPSLPPQHLMLHAVSS